MKPSVLRIRAISTLSFELGNSTRSWRDWIPFRIRVNISAIGSVIDIVESLSLPTGFGDPWDVAAERKLTEADSAKLKLAEETARAPAPFAAVALARGELRCPRSFDDQ